MENNEGGKNKGVIGGGVWNTVIIVKVNQNVKTWKKCLIFVEKWPETDFQSSFQDFRLFVNSGSLQV